MQNTTKLNLTQAILKTNYKLLTLTLELLINQASVSKIMQRFAEKKRIMQKSRWDPVKLTQNKL